MTDHSRAMPLSSVRVMVIGAMAALAFCTSPAAHAQSCTASAIAPAFGVYNATANVTLANGLVNVSCNVVSVPVAVFYSIRLGMGSQPNGTQRQLAGGPGNTGRLPYNVYCDPTYTTVWGDGSGQTCVVNGGSALLLGALLNTHPVYGRINGGSFVPAGSYSDAVTVEVLY